MHRTAGVLEQLDNEWNDTAHSLRGRRRLRRWSDPDAILRDFDTLDDLVEHVNSRGHIERSDQILLTLLELSTDDDLAARTVLQAMMPAMKRMTSTFSTCGAWSAEETAAVVVAAMWDRIRTYPVARRRRKVSANLALDTRQKVWRTGMKQVHGRCPRPTSTRTSEA